MDPAGVRGASPDMQGRILTSGGQILTIGGESWANPYRKEAKTCPEGANHDLRVDNFFRLLSPNISAKIVAARLQ